MGRILIGNIMGPQGPQGIQGIQGPIGPIGPVGPMSPLINNALQTTAGVGALDAAMGKTLQDQITQTNSDLTVSDITVVPNEVALVSHGVECFKVGKMAFLSGRIRSAAQGGDLILLSVGAICARTVYAPIAGDVDTVAFVGLDAGGGNVKFYIPKIDKDYRFFIAFPIL